jgi:iron complex transport system substrate-binding protein
LTAKTTIRGAFLALLLLSTAAPAAPPGPSEQAAEPPAKPRRIVSLYLCADQLLLQLVERDRIVSLSHLARRIEDSYMAAEAGGIPINYGTAEEAIALRPDLVVTGPWAQRSRIDLLRRFDVPVLEVGLVDTLDGIRHETLRVAAALGEADRGRALVADMDARLAAARDAGTATGRRPTAAVYMASGVAIGRGTLVDELLRVAGFDNLAWRLGLDGYGYLPLETLVVARPDLLVMDRERPRRASLAAERLQHPALRDLFAGPHVAALPERLWTCPGTFTAEAVDILAKARAALAGEKRP